MDWNRKEAVAKSRESRQNGLETQRICHEKPGIATEWIESLDKLSRKAVNRDRMDWNPREAVAKSRNRDRMDWNPRKSVAKSLESRQNGLETHRSCREKPGIATEWTGIPEKLSRKAWNRDRMD
jgi:hypothetical protein